MRVQGKVAIVTGAASGIGAAIAAALVAAGAKVVGGDLNLPQPVQSPTDAEPDMPLLVQADCASTEGIRTLIETAEATYGPVDLYVANAGVGVGDGLDASEADWELAQHVNVMGHVRAARLLVPGWVERGSGYFVSTASAAGLVTQIGSPVYSVTKAAAVAFAQWLAVTYGDAGVRVSCLVPLGVETPFLDSGESGAVSDLAARAVRAGHVLSPQEVAVALLATIEAEQFYCTPHPEVLVMAQRKAADVDRWIRGMQRYRDSL